MTATGRHVQTQKRRKEKRGSFILLPSTRLLKEEKKKWPLPTLAYLKSPARKEERG